MTFYVYILFSPSINRYYIGTTGEELKERIRRRNTNHNGFTGKKGDWELRYSESYASKTDSYQREKEMKSWKSRKMIEKLIYG